MYCPQCIVIMCMHENREEKKISPQGGGSGGLIGASVVAQCSESEVRRNSSLTSISLQPNN